MRRMYSQNQLENQVKEVKKDIATLVDYQGHERFVEGVINLAPALDSDITKVYGKWSLSGTHLLIVLCVKSPAKALIYDNYAYIELPEWILSKITPLIEGGNYVDSKSITWYDASNNTQSGATQLRYDITRGLYISMSAITLTTEKVCRIAFDLLIDSD